MKRRVKIVATIGPASRDLETLRSLIHAGMDVARLNFSHGNYAEHRQTYERIRSLSEEMDQPVTILQDIQGPKIRLGLIDGDKIILEENQILILTTKEILGNHERISIDFPRLPDFVSPGSRILVDDGTKEFVVLESKPDALEDQIKVRVIKGGEIRSNKGVNLPGAQLNVPALTQKDLHDIAFGLQLGVDALAVSFVQTAQDIQTARQVIRQENSGYSPLVIAKLERPSAIENLNAIVQEADGVMIARGDLGVEMPPETVPIAQKQIIECANKNAKIVITATQMLESMIQFSRPTRAEASDVANAVFDGTDALMLSGETAIGSYPVQALEMMSAIIQKAEANITSWGRWRGEPDIGLNDDDTFFMTAAATKLAEDRNVAALAAFTETGRTARLLSKMRPIVPILGCTSDLNTYRKINLFWGVEPIRVSQVQSIPEIISAVELGILEKHAIEIGQQVIFTFGYPVQKGCPTNMAYLHTIGCS